MGEAEEARQAELNPAAFDEDMDASDAAAEAHLPPPMPPMEDPEFPDEEEDDEEEEAAAEGEDPALAKHGKKILKKKHHTKVRIQPDPVSGKLPKGVADPLTKEQKEKAKTHHKKVESPA